MNQSVRDSVIYLAVIILTIGRETAEDLWPVSTLPQASSLQMNCTENSKQIVPENKLCGRVPIFYFHVSVSDIYISTIGPQTQFSKTGLIFLNILILAVVHSKDDIISFTNSVTTLRPKLVPVPETITYSINTANIHFYSICPLARLKQQRCQKEEYRLCIF